MGFRSTEKLDQMYPVELIQHMIDQLTNEGFVNIEKTEDLEPLFEEKESILLVINAVCGCAEYNARPAAITSLKNDVIPKKLYTALAGQYQEVVQKIREHYSLSNSSPSLVLIKNQEIILYLERHHLEGRAADYIAEFLMINYDKKLSK